MDTHTDPTTVYAAWTPERGWHTVTAAEHAALQRLTVARLTGRAPNGWVARAQAGALVVKDMTGGAA